MALVAPTITATLPPAVIAEIMADATSDAFTAGEAEVQVKVPCEDPKLRANRSYDVKQAANDARTKANLETVKPDTGYVIRSRSKLNGKTLTVTLYWGRKVDTPS